MLLFDAMSVFARKSRLASCAVSLASVSTAPKTPSSSIASGSLEAVSAPDVCADVVQVVEVSESSSSGERGTMSDDIFSSAPSSAPRSPERTRARHALLKCSTMPLSTSPKRVSRPPATSTARDSMSTSHMRRKRSCSSSSLAEHEGTIVFPTASEEAEKEAGCGVTSTEVKAHPDLQPPRKRARRSAVSVCRPCPVSPPRPQSSASSPDGSSTTPSPPRLRRSPSPPSTRSHHHISANLRFQASVYHTLVLHQEMVAEMASLFPSRPPSKGSEALELLQSQDSLLIARLYFTLLLSAVPVMALPRERAQRGLSNKLGLSDEEESCASLGGNAGLDLDADSGVASANESMEIDGAPEVQLRGPDEQLEAPSPSSPASDDGPVYAGPPFDSLAHMVAIMTIRYRSRVSNRPRHRSKAGSRSGAECTARSKLGLESITKEDLVAMLESVDEVRRACGFDELDVGEMMDIDGYGTQESALRSTCAEGEKESDDPELDEEDMEWRALRRDLLLAGTTSTVSQPIPIRPPSPVPSQLDDDSKSPPLIRRMPIRDVTNVSGSKVRRSSAGKKGKSPPSLRKPVPKINFPVHARAASGAPVSTGAR
ncbi:hypothetical protein DFP72DRAFT_919370 [Ephemerocybe angulata]|uniref:Uncharacterized protein n=1 Tax=Ephemerocybe angulata TaxID=980116 RepID=A0A8H6HL32_9AGAR|nr:hypothetical protein DFP72DRAFT_919370 [Tulosesus angulatus]